MEVSRFVTRARIGKIVASDTFDGKITNWFHAACLLCHGRKQFNHVSSNKYLIIIRRKHLESADMQRFMDSVADSELKDDRSIIHMSRLQSASPLTVRLAFHLSSKLHIVSFLGEGFVLSKSFKKALHHLVSLKITCLRHVKTPLLSSLGT